MIASLNHPPYSVSSVVKTVGVSARQLYYWEQVGIITPTYEQFGTYEYRRYSQQDLDKLMKIKQLLDEGYTLKAASQRVNRTQAVAIAGANGQEGGCYE